MLEKPSENEDEYFVRQELERKRRAAEERQSKVAVEQREQQRALHFMKCPKCGMQLEEIPFGNIRIDKCFGCSGVWLDPGELEKIAAKDAGFVGKLHKIFG